MKRKPHVEFHCVKSGQSPCYDPVSNALQYKTTSSQIFNQSKDKYGNNQYLYNLFLFVSGFLAYYEICSNSNYMSNRQWNADHQAPYTYRGDQWVGYDDSESIILKVLSLLSSCYTLAASQAMPQIIDITL